MIDVLFKCSRINNNVIEIYSYKFSKKVLEYKVHKPLESSRCIAETKRHNVEFVESLVRDERCLLLICFIHFHLPIPTGKVEGGEPVCCSEGFEKFINAR